MADRMIIETTELRKTYPGVEALRGLNLQVPAGSICGFLGRNGAGKTTTMKILLGMAHPTSGEARVFGLTTDSVEIRLRTGFVSEEKDLYGYMTVEEMIRFTASFFPKWRADLEKRYLHNFDLPPQRKIKALSRGMRTKLALLLPLGTPRRYPCRSSLRGGRMHNKAVNTDAQGRLRATRAPILGRGLLLRYAARRLV